MIYFMYYMYLYIKEFIKCILNIFWCCLFLYIDEGIDEESEFKNLKDELFLEVNKRGKLKVVLC